MSAQRARRAPRSTAILLCVILLGFALRVYELDAQSFWYDEGVTAQVAQLGVDELARWTANDIQPPLYYLLVRGWLQVTPFGELILRFPSALFGVLLLPLLWALGRRLWGAGAGLLAALVAALSPLMVYYGQEARMYTLLVALVSLAALVVLKLTASLPKRERPLSALIVYALAGLAAMYTHYFAGFALLALALYWLVIWWTDDRDRRRLLAFGVANAVILLGYLPWLPAMLKRFAVDSSYWSGTLKLDEALIDVGMNFTVGATEVMLETTALRWLPWFGLAALLWALAVALGRRRAPQKPPVFLLLWALIPSLLILTLAYRTPKFNARYLMMSWPAWALLAGGGAANLWLGLMEPLGVSRFRRNAAKTLAALSLLLVLAAQTQGLVNWFSDDNFAKSAWREAITYMYRNRGDDETVLLVSGHSYPVFDTYVPPRLGLERIRLPELDILDVNQVIGWEEAARALNEQLVGKGGVWLFLWQDKVVDPTGVTETLLDRYADPQPTPEFAYLRLRHYRLRPGQWFPTQPPMSGPEIDFGSLLQLAGAETAQDGLWLYWRALQAQTPDLQAAITVKDADGTTLFEDDMRPAGYNFPTSRWQAGETYPLWLPFARARAAARVQIVVYDAASGDVIGEGEIQVRP